MKVKGCPGQFQLPQHMTVKTALSCEMSCPSDQRSSSCDPQVPSHAFLVMPPYPCHTPSSRDAWSPTIPSRRAVIPCDLVPHDPNPSRCHSQRSRRTASTDPLRSFPAIPPPGPSNAVFLRPEIHRAARQDKCRFDPQSHTSYSRINVRT
jgi:hypothetical protein